MQHSGPLSNGGCGDVKRSLNKILRSARSLLGQMTSHSILQTATQLTTSASQAVPELEEEAWDGIVGLIFRRATRDTIHPLETMKFCAQLCYYLTRTTGDEGPGLSSGENWLDQKIFGLCTSSLPQGGGSEALVQNPLSTMPESVQHPQGSTRPEGARSEYPSAERITFFVADLYREKFFTASQVHVYIGRLIASGATTEQCAIGLCTLMEQHGQTLDASPWRDTMDSCFRWINVVAMKSLAGKRVATRLEAITRLRVRNWEAGQTKFELINHEVSSLLKKLTMDKFDSISDQIIEYANKSENEKDGATLMQVIKLVFEKAKDEAAFSEMYARLCQKMVERVSPSIQDESIRGANGQPIMGGALFRKYLLNRCQEDFEQGWSAKETAAALAASKAGDDKATEAAVQANGEAVLYSEEYYAAAKAKRQGLGLVRFLGELFKLRMLTERIMHECIKKLLSNAVNPKDEEIESLCALLAVVGQNLDNAKARNHMDIYFERMQEMARGSNINSRTQLMLQDVIELRARHWQDHVLGAPSVGAGQHGSGRGDDGSRIFIQHGGSRRSEQRGDHGPQADGWNVPGGTSAARPPAIAGDLSQFGKISKPASTLSFGPSSVFRKKDPKREASMSRASSSANMFSALSAAGSDAHGAGSQKPSVNMVSGGTTAVEGGSVRKRLNLLPRSKPAEAVAAETKSEKAAMSEADAQKRVKEDVKEYLGVENVEEAIMALEALSAEHRHIFIDKMAASTLEGGNKVVLLAEKLFFAVHKQGVCSPEAFERGLLPTVEMADDMSIDVPKTYEWLARLMHAASLDKPRVEEMAAKIAVLGEPKIQPRNVLLQEFDKVSHSPGGMLRY